MQLYPGVARVIEDVGECRLVPVTIRYEYLKAHRASIIASVGDVMDVTITGRDQRKELVTYITKLMSRSEDELQEKILSADLSDFIDILR
jgi:1-acyl-sn-glycerol-3-phosphate acyltransferase